MESQQPQNSTTTSSNSDAQPTTSPVTSAISIKLPPYWPSDPALWFAQVEAQFTTRAITAEPTKYAYVVGSLQPEVAQEVRDLLINPPADTPYTQLKTALVKRTSASEQQRLHQLLHTEELGDRKPTQLYRRMQQLLGNRQLEPSIMKQLFLQRLPTNAQLILASTTDELDTASLAKMADKILEVSPIQPTPSTLATVVPQSAPTPPAQSIELRELRDLVAQLTTTITNLNLNFTPPQHGHVERRRSRSPTRRSPSPFHENDRTTTEQRHRAPLCWYHTKFGASAKKCSPPCSFSTQTPPPSNYNARQ